MRLKKSLTLQIVGYGFASALLIWLLKVFEFQFYVRNLTLEIYLGIVAILFSGFGIWLGLILFQYGLTRVLGRILNDETVSAPQSDEP